MSVGSNIRCIRKARGITQERLAEEAGISQAMLCQVEKGLKNPSLLVSAEMAKILGCRIEDFLKD